MPFHLPTTIFGRQPTAIAAVIDGILPMLVLLHVAYLSTEQVGLIAACITAIAAAYVAFSTDRPSLAVIIGIIQAGVALGAGYGFTLSPQDVAVIVGVTGVIAHFFNWDRTSPKVKVAPKAADGTFDVSTLPADHVDPATLS